MAQRETLTQQWATDQIRSYSAEQYSQPQSGGADPATIALLADKLIAAEHPILICGYAGRNAKAAKLIEEISLFAGIAVFEGNQTFNISHEFPCFLGYSPNKHMPKADVGILVDVDVPWFPADVSHKSGSFWAHIDIDTLKAASPMWTFPGNVAHAGRQRPHPRAAARRAEEEGDAEVQGGRASPRRGADRRTHRVARAGQEARLQQGQGRRDRPALRVLRAQQAAQG